LIADVGLLGLPNAGKSTLIRAVSAARPKVADYPFTTLHPNLGVVDVGQHRSFVMAGIPGLSEGAAQGAGLGMLFLKRLQRTRLLLHLVDIAPLDPQADPVRDARAIVGELKKFSKSLALKPRWLVLNKRDLLPASQPAPRAGAKTRASPRRGTRSHGWGASAGRTRGQGEAARKALAAPESAPPGHARAQRHIAGAVLLCLTGSLFGGLGIGQEISVSTAASQASEGG